MVNQELESLPEKARQMFELIAEACSSGHSPSYGWLMDRMGYKSKSPVSNYVRQLIAVGVVSKDVNGHLQLSDGAREFTQGIPYIAEATAGCLSYAPDEWERDRIDIPGRFPRDAVVVRVIGDSMTGRHIFDGDYVIVDRSKTPRNGDVVVVIADETATVKEWREDDNGRVTLRSANRNYKDITPRRVPDVVGVVSSVWREFE